MDTVDNKGYYGKSDLHPNFSTLKKVLLLCSDFLKRRHDLKDGFSAEPKRPSPNAESVVCFPPPLLIKIVFRRNKVTKLTSFGLLDHQRSQTSSVDFPCIQQRKRTVDGD